VTEQQNILLQIEGMTCDACAAHVRKALTAVAGVSDVELPDWRAAKAEMLTDAGVSDELIVKAVEDAGYRALVRERRAVGQGRNEFAVGSSKRV